LSKNRIVIEKILLNGLRLICQKNKKPKKENFKDDKICEHIGVCQATCRLFY